MLVDYLSVGAGGPIVEDAQILGALLLEFVQSEGFAAQSHKVPC